MERRDFERKIAQLEMDKFAMEKELSRLKERLVNEDLAWLEYQAFRSQLLSRKTEKQYFIDANRQILQLRQWMEVQKRRQPHQKHQSFFFAGMLFFFIAALFLGWYAGFAGTEGFVVHKTAQLNVFLDKDTYKVGESVYIRIVPKVPFMTRILHNGEEITLPGQIFRPNKPGTYQIEVWAEKDGLKSFKREFTVAE